MNTRLLTSVGYLLLLAAAAAPSAAGHDERGSFGTSSGVSGRYFGAADTAVAIWPTAPLDSLGTGLILCDLEVAQDDPSHPDNEVRIDGSSVHAGQAPDSWDDGGFGGACHTGHYRTVSFNTSGCQAGQTARGSNGAGDLWIAAACDWKTEQGGASSGGTLLLCLANAALASRPQAVLGPPLPDFIGFFREVQEFLDCADGLADCLLHPSCGALGAFQFCGSDGATDAIDFGDGSGTADPAVFPTATGVTNPAPAGTSPCPGDSEAASIFVFDTVTVSDTLLVEWFPAGAGDLWTA